MTSTPFRVIGSSTTNVVRAMRAEPTSPRRR
jgi:hypothetical protein